MEGWAAGQEHHGAEHTEQMELLRVQPGLQMQALLQLAGGPGSSSSQKPNIHLPKMLVDHDAQAFLEAFEVAAEACRWPREEWPTATLVGGSRAGSPQPSPISMGTLFKHLKGCAGPDGKQPRGTEAAVPEAGPVQCPAHTQGGKPEPAPRRRLPPRLGPVASPRGPGRVLPGVLPPPPVPGSVTVRPEPQGVPQMPGPECWRCEQLGHFRRECPLMEVGQVVGPPTSTHGSEGAYCIPVRVQGSEHCWIWARCSPWYDRA